MTENDPTQQETKTTTGQAGKSKLVFSLLANKDVNIPIIFGIAGFLFSILILNKGCADNNGYHDIYLENKKELVSGVIENRIKSLDELITSLKQFNEKDTTEEIIKEKEERLRSAYETMSASKSELNNLKFWNIDTSTDYYLKYISVDRDAFLNGINSMDTVKFNKKNSDEDSTVIQRKIEASIRDTCAVLNKMPIYNKASLVLKQNTRADQFSFFSDYPIFGFWYFFSIVQMTLWFILMPIIVGIAKRADNESDILKYNADNAFIFCLLPLVVVGLFVALFYIVIVDATVITDNYFLDSYNSKMLMYGIPGYLVATLCFGVYLFLANKWELLNDDAKKKHISTSSNEELDKKYKLLRSLFNMAFLCSAIILSVFVFWVGILFNSINSLEAMNFYRHLSGKNFLNYDFVYLLGLLHSLLLLIFYVPVHLRFNALTITQQHETDAAINSSALKKVWKGFSDVLSPILITTSPLLATILQKVMTLIFQE